jgi:hypothetical protein
MNDQIYEVLTMYTIRLTISHQCISIRHTLGKAKHNIVLSFLLYNKTKIIQKQDITTFISSVSLFFGVNMAGLAYARENKI